MLLAIYKNKQYYTIYLPDDMKDEVDKFMAKRKYKWYVMSYLENEKHELPQECN
jgi:hypothetical protein